MVIANRPVFSLDVPQYVHKITHLWKFWLNWSSKKKTPLLNKFVCFQMSNKRLQAWSLLIFAWKITSFSKTTYIIIIIIITGLEITNNTHSNYCGALCFCCGALCKVPIQTYILPIEVALTRGKLLQPSKSPFKFKACFYYLILPPQCQLTSENNLWYPQQTIAAVPCAFALVPSARFQYKITFAPTKEPLTRGKLLQPSKSKVQCLLLLPHSPLSVSADWWTWRQLHCFNNMVWKSFVLVFFMSKWEETLGMVWKEHKHTIAIMTYRKPNGSISRLGLRGFLLYPSVNPLSWSRISAICLNQVIKIIIIMDL